MKVFRVLFGILFITALIAALLGYTHQIAIAAICAVVLLTTNPKQNEPI